MMPNIVHLDAMARYKRDKWLHEAEQDRLVQLARAARRKRGRSSVQALTWLGQRLITWGQELQRRSGFVVDAGVLAAANECQPC